MWPPGPGTEGRGTGRPPVILTISQDAGAGRHFCHGARKLELVDVAERLAGGPGDWRAGVLVGGSHAPGPRTTIGGMSHSPIDPTDMPNVVRRRGFDRLQERKRPDNCPCNWLVALWLDETLDGDIHAELMCPDCGARWLRQGASLDSRGHISSSLRREAARSTWQERRTDATKRRE